MTICSAVKLIDGIVLGSDSLSINITQDGALAFDLNNFSHAKKLFRFGKTSIGIVTYGLGQIGAVPVESLIEQAQQSYVGTLNVLEIANFLYELALQYYQPFHIPEFVPAQTGFIVAGYSEADQIPTMVEFIVPSGASEVFSETDQIGFICRGANRAFSRLYNGIDPYLLEISPKIQNISEAYRMKIDFPNMNLLEGTEFVRFILETTIRYHEFNQAEWPICGRPLQMAVISHRDGFTIIEN